jgi:hypothetical protein
MGGLLTVRQLVKVPDQESYPIIYLYVLYLFLCNTVNCDFLSTAKALSLPLERSHVGTRTVSAWAHLAAASGIALDLIARQSQHSTTTKNLTTGERVLVLHSHALTLSS